MRRLRRTYVSLLVALVVVICLASPAAPSDPSRYSVGAGAAYLSFTGGNYFSFDPEITYAVWLGHRFADKWQVDLQYSAVTFSNDQGADSTAVVGGIANNAPLDMEMTRLGITASRMMFNSESMINLQGGVGGGLLVWSAVNPDSGTTYVIMSDKDEKTDFAASEVFITATAGISIRPAPRLSFLISGQFDYLTGAGESFEAGIGSARDRTLVGGTARISYHFGSYEKPPQWRSAEAWENPATETVKPADRDSDGDGVFDFADRCAGTPSGVRVGRTGCPLDADHDGIPDGLDDCPATSLEASGMVDIHGCPVDSDFDGIPDYLDACPFGLVGAHVDQQGCVIDSDNDGVPDGLDDCPFTLPDVDVDKFGCIDLEMFSEPMVLNIKYPSGGFDIDPHNRKRIKRLAGLLNFVTDVKLDINGYTDNIGTPQANRELSEKRAARVRDYLVTLGVAENRIKVSGKGETNFIASNQTAEGRALNRRIEIVFHR